MFLKNEMRKPSEVLHNPSLPFTTTYLRSAGASAFKSGTGLGRGELQRGRWGDRKQEGPCMSSALLQWSCLHLAHHKALLRLVQAEIWWSLAAKFSEDLQYTWHLSSLQGGSRASSGTASFDCQKNVFWMIPITCFRWKNKKSCNEWAAQAQAEPKKNFLLMSKSYQHTKHAIDCSPETAGSLSLTKSSCTLFIS